MPYKIDITYDADQDLERLSARDRGIILAEIRTHLSYEPTKPSGKRKQLEKNDLNIDWELRVGTFRVLYDIVGNQVIISAIATKKRAEYYLRGEKIKL